MASNMVAAPTTSPLSFMTKLSPSVYVYRPTAPSPAPSTPSFSSSSSKPAPRLILLVAWMGAREQHIAKYLLQYQALYPTAPILLVRSEPWHFLRPRSAGRELAPAVPVIRDVFPDLDDGPSLSSSSADKDKASETTTTATPQLLIHAWSNGGAASLHTLRRALGSGSGSGTRPLLLPPYTLLLDSAPGQFHYGASVAAFAAGLSGPVLWLLLPLLHALTASYWLRHEVWGRGGTGPLAVVAAALNEEALAGRRGGREVRRTYVYSEGDRLVDWRDVEGHAGEAERKGFVVRRERFEGSAHVAHARADGERYWRVVRETWEGVEYDLDGGSRMEVSALEGHRESSRL
ncbi:hypothetical protein VTK56DRAFT_9201 [Thermocarpiscus australiensis]